MLVLRAEGSPGDTIGGLAQEMIDLAVRLDVALVCNLNGVEVVVNKYSTLSDIEKMYKDIRQSYLYKGR